MRHPYFWDYPPHRRRVLTATAATGLAGLLIASAGQLHWTATPDPAKPTLLAERASQNPVPTRKSDDESRSPDSDDSSGSAHGSDGKDSHRHTPGDGSESGSSSGEGGGPAAETSPGSTSSPATGSVLPPVAGPLPGAGQPGDGPLEKPGVGSPTAAPLPPPGASSGAALPAPAIPAPSWGPGAATSAASSGGSSESGSLRTGRGGRTDSTADAPPQATVDRAARQQRIRRALPPGFVPTAPASPPAVSAPAGSLATATSPTPPVLDSSAVSVPTTSPALTQAVPPVAGGSSSSWPGAQPGAALTPVACPAGVTVAGATCYQSQAPASDSPASPSAPAVAAAAPEVGSPTAPATSLPATAPTRSAASNAPVNVNGHRCQLSDQVRYHATGNWWGDLMSWAMGQAQQCAQDMGSSGEWNGDTGSGGSSSSSGSSKKSHRKASDK